MIVPSGSNSRTASPRPPIPKPTSACPPRPSHNTLKCSISQETYCPISSGGILLFRDYKRGLIFWLLRLVFSVVPKAPQIVSSPFPGIWSLPTLPRHYILSLIVFFVYFWIFADFQRAQISIGQILSKSALAVLSPQIPRETLSSEIVLSLLRACTIALLSDSRKVKSRPGCWGLMELEFFSLWLSWQLLGGRIRWARFKAIKIEMQWCLRARNGFWKGW